VLQFAQEVMALVNNPKAYIDYRPLPTDDPKQRQPDITKARTILDWEPRYDRAAGMKITYEYFKKAVTTH
jgi:dTDP-glucose 4,6-dehydratase